MRTEGRQCLPDCIITFIVTTTFIGITTFTGITTLIFAGGSVDADGREAVAPLLHGTPTQPDSFFLGEKLVAARLLH